MGFFDLFKRKPSIDELSSDVEHVMRALIKAKVAKVKAKGPFYCLLLCYCAEDFAAGWPPFLLLGSEAERRRIVERGDQITYYLWAPDEMRNHEIRDQGTNVEVALHTDKPLNDLCARHLNLMDANHDFAPAMNVLRRMARSFNKRDWFKLIQVTPDFVVAAVDNTGEVDPLEDIQAVIPTARFQALRDRGWI